MKSMKTAPKPIERIAPNIPITNPTAMTTISPRIKPSDIPTTPIDGIVSRPENGGARNAIRDKMKTAIPKSVAANLSSRCPDILGREIFSILLMNLTSFGSATDWVFGPSSLDRQRFGSQMVLR